MIAYAPQFETVAITSSSTVMTQGFSESFSSIIEATFPMPISFPPSPTPIVGTTPKAMRKNKSTLAVLSLMLTPRIFAYSRAAFSPHRSTLIIPTGVYFPSSSMHQLTSAFIGMYKTSIPSDSKKPLQKSSVRIIGLKPSFCKALARNKVPTGPSVSAKPAT